MIHSVDRLDYLYIDACHKIAEIAADERVENSKQERHSKKGKA